MLSTILDILDPEDLTKAALAILLCPLAGFVVQVFFGKRLPRQGDWLPTGCMFISLSIEPHWDRAPDRAVCRGLAFLRSWRS